MKRTTIRLDDHLYAEAKRLAASTGRTLTSLIEDSLRETLARHSAERQRSRVELPIFQGRGLQPGVDLDDSAAVLELMEGRDAAV